MGRVEKVFLIGGAVLVLELLAFNQIGYPSLPFYLILGISVLSFFASAMLASNKDAKDYRKELCEWYSSSKHLTLEQLVNDPSLTAGHINGLHNIRFLIKKGLVK